jgi:ABC-type tungstate transport system permease subunit
VLQGADHDIVRAFEKIAAAGEAGTAEFVSRGGNPGTTVAEHKIWGQTTGITTCDVSDDDGGYVSPSTTTGPCGTTIAYPDWYHATGLTQGPNIVSADACNFGHSGDCYVLTDRGTFAFLEATKAIQDLRVVTRDNAADAPGGASLLVNSFHAYAVNPARFGADAGLNPTGATELLDWLTSPGGQQAVGSYLADGGDAPFVPSASPTITWLRTPGPLRGVLTNPVPGTPPLAGIKLEVTLNGRTVRVTTDADGIFAVSGPWSSPVQVEVPAITQIENDSLDPVFGDLLTATTVRLE